MPHPAELERRTSTGRRWTGSVALTAVAALFAVGTVTPAAAAPKAPTVQAADKDKDGNAAPPEALLLDTTGAFVSSDGPTVALLGVSDLVVVVRDGVVMVAARERAQDVKRLINELRARGRDDLL